jgi:hypothetical protein
LGWAKPSSKWREANTMHSASTVLVRQMEAIKVFVWMSTIKVAWSNIFYDFI